MPNHCPENERIKRDYLIFLKQAKGQSESTVDSAGKALHRFEEYTRNRNFKAFSYQQAIAFKSHLANQKANRSGEKLSKATLRLTLSQLKCFFEWLYGRPGYKSCFQYSDAEYFSLSDKDKRIATAKREQQTPTIEQIEHVLRSMGATTDIEQRNRALVAFTLLTGARDSAIASMRLKHVDLVGCKVQQDAREVKTKNSKTFVTYFFPVGDLPLKIVRDWVEYLKLTKIWGNDDPLFPSTKVATGVDRQFTAIGLAKVGWSGASPIRAIFRAAFNDAGLPYFNPHSFRTTLARLGEARCKSPEEFKAWSQNIGHEQVLTTFTNYGSVTTDRQAEIIRNLGSVSESNVPGLDALAEAVFRKFKGEEFRL
jgi:site-specific recombinase XerD